MQVKIWQRYRFNYNATWQVTATSGSPADYTTVDPEINVTCSVEVD